MISYKILFITCIAQCMALPARREDNIREINQSAPADINSLNGQSTESKNNNDVEATIKEVEDLIKANPSLPRLTRGEILDIIDNITKSDEAKSNTNRDQKAIMLVMPYSSDGGDLQTLYTKPPVTQIVGDVVKPVEKPKRRKPTWKPEVYSEIKSSTVKSYSTTTPKPTTIKQEISKPYETTVKHYRRRNPTTTSTQATIVTSTSVSYREVTGKPYRDVSIKPYNNNNYYKANKDLEVTFKPIIVEEVTFRPIQVVDNFEPINNDFKPLETITFKPLRKHRTTKTPKLDRYPNHKYVDDEPFIVTSTSVFPTVAPTKSSHGINIVNPPRFVAKPEVPLKTSAKIEKPIYRPHTTTQKPNTPQALDGMILPNDFKEVLNNLDKLLKNDPKYSSQYDSLTPLTPQKPITQENVQELLASIGAYQSTTTSSTELPDISNVAHNLTPDMKDLLMSFGLLADPNHKPQIAPIQEALILEPSSEPSAESYSSFKPLPQSTNTNNEEGMDDFLASFGLGHKGQRSQKSISVTSNKNSVKNHVNLEVVPDEFRDVLKDIGITDKDLISGKKVEKQHVFNPVDKEVASNDEITRLNKLLDMIKQLEKLNGTNLTDDDLKKIDLDSLKSLVGSFNVPLDEQGGFNPLDYDTSVIRNEVKRQQSTTEEPKLTISLPVDGEAKNPSLAALEDSFGGNSDVKSEVIETTTEIPKKTGFYYLVDWNTFLDIDNQKGKRVNLRFQPTIGDPKRFFNVAVP